ncbi:hypothetical protein [Micromonospora sp. NPDC005205]|uniref:hypothetical protein n=1 Tax=Micromonospora sp. NPDC005205 TaxID=3156714 RepID=UPI0033AFC6D0
MVINACPGAGTGTGRSTTARPRGSPNFLIITAFTVRHPSHVSPSFPTKQALATEAFADQMNACVAVVDEGLTDPDPWRGLCLVIEQLCELEA